MGGGRSGSEQPKQQQQQQQRWQVRSTGHEPHLSIASSLLRRNSFRNFIFIYVLRAAEVQELAWPEEEQEQEEQEEYLLCQESIIYALKCRHPQIAFETKLN